jgi:spoIIIJ-associated protein
MEWVETTGDTIEEAKSAALDQLGVAEDDAEFEVLEEPKQGLFGRTRGEARVRARVRPTSPRAKADRRDRGPKREKRQGESKRGPRKERSPERAPRAEREPKTNATPIDPTTVSAAATTFLEGLLVASDIRGSVSATVSGEDIDINVDGDGVSMYVGAKGATLMALQDLTRVVSQRRLGDHETHLRVDVALADGDSSAAE